MKTTFPALIALLCLLTVAAAQEEDVPEPLSPGTEAPTFTATTLEDATIDLSEWHGRVAVLNYFITWYRDAGRHLSMMEELADRYSGEGMRLVSISLDEGPRGAEDVRRLVREQELAHPVVLDPEQEICGLYHVRALPAIFVIGRDGKIAYYHEGYAEGDARRLEKAITAALGVELPEPEEEQEQAEAEDEPEEPEEPVCHCFRRKSE